MRRTRANADRACAWADTESPVANNRTPMASESRARAVFPAVCGRIQRIRRRRGSPTSAPCRSFGQSADRGRSPRRQSATRAGTRRGRGSRGSTRSRCRRRAAENHPCRSAARVPRGDIRAPGSAISARAASNTPHEDSPSSATRFVEVRRSDPASPPRAQGHRTESTARLKRTRERDPDAIRPVPQIVRGMSSAISFDANARSTSRARSSRR